jgi:2-polyprenyl-6-hydroxyphenyl methylase/3-demethylubiquinone-9 3-methyltransferase
MSERAKRVVGIDTSVESIELARESSGSASRCEFLEMDALELVFAESEFDKVVCVQNGICAFGIDQEELIRQALRVARPGGTILLSTYSERFWECRLAWFEAQSEAGLVGSIDYEKTKNGTIVCRDGFRSGTMLPDDFHTITQSLGVKSELTEVDESSLFCEIFVE